MKIFVLVVGGLCMGAACFLLAMSLQAFLEDRRPLALVTDVLGLIDCLAAVSILDGVGRAR